MQDVNENTHICLLHLKFDRSKANTRELQIVGDWQGTEKILHVFEFQANEVTKWMNMKNSKT